MEQNMESRKRPTHIRPTDIWWKCKSNSIKKGSTNGAAIIGYTGAKTPQFMPWTMYKN